MAFRVLKVRHFWFATGISMPSLDKCMFHSVYLPLVSLFKRTCNEIHVSLIIAMDVEDANSYKI